MSAAARAHDTSFTTSVAWRNRDESVISANFATGFPELDFLLPGSGWPTGALTEIFVERPGIGELQLLMPSAARLTQSGRWLAMIGAPYTLDTPALAACGIRLKHLLLLRPQSADEQAWSCEQLINSGNCGMVLMWIDQLPEHTMRRLRLAAERSGVIVVLYRSRRAPSFPNAALHLHVSRNDGRTVINLPKGQENAVSQPVKLDLLRSLTRRSSMTPLPLIPATTHHRQAAH